MKIECDRCRTIYNNNNTEPYKPENEDLPCFMHTVVDYYGRQLLGQGNGFESNHLCPKCTYELWKWIYND